jgi:hypothetical protein
MIYFIVLCSAAVLLNVIGRILILKKDTAAADGWRRGLKICPGAELAHVLFRWQYARLGGAMCALSLVMAAPVAYQLIQRKQLDQFSLADALREMTEVKRPATKPAVDLAKLRKVAAAKEKQVTELNAYLQTWFATLTTRKNALSPDATLESRSSRRPPRSAARWSSTAG